jgi:hypothetical protein
MNRWATAISRGTRSGPGEHAAGASVDHGGDPSMRQWTGPIAQAGHKSYLISIF